MDLDLFVDEFHRSALAALPPDFMDLSSISTARERILGVLDAARQESLPEAIAIDDVWVPGLSDGPDVGVKVYRPQCISRVVGALYWIHGGGMVMHSADIDDLQCAMRAVSHGCVVVSVDYRLSTIDYRLSTIDYRLSTIDLRLSTGHRRRSMIATPVFNGSTSSPRPWGSTAIGL